MTTQAPVDIYLDADDYRIDPRALMPSPTNRIINRNAEDIRELADNIQAVGGIMQALVIRPLPDKYRDQAQPGQEFEIVAGERRWHAAMLLNLAEVPVRIARLTDGQVVTLQATENIQRKGYTPIEQAQALDHMRSAGMHVSEIAKQLGKSTAHVYAKLKLLDLSPESREALSTGLIDESAAVPLSRLPASIQPKALAEITGFRDVEAGERYPTRQQIVMLQRDYTRNLRKATFDRHETYGEQLTPCVLCAHCGCNQPDIAGGGAENLCTNPGCFEAKTEAHNIRLLDLPEGIERVEIPRARENCPTSYTDYDAAGYRWLGGTCHADIMARTYSELLSAHSLSVPTALHVCPVSGATCLIALKSDLAEVLGPIINPKKPTEDTAKVIDKEPEPKPEVEEEPEDDHIPGLPVIPADTRDDYTLYNLAVEHIKKTGIPSVSGVQRELRISYQKAVNTFEQMTKAGILNHDPRRASPYTIASKDNELAQAQALCKACEQNPPMLIAWPLTRIIAEALAEKPLPEHTEQDCSAVIVKELAMQAFGAGIDALTQLAQALNVDVAEIQRTYPTADAKASPTPTKSNPAAPAEKWQAHKSIQFRHPENPAIAWTGHGRKPQWVVDWLANGKSIEDLRVAGQQTFA